MTLKECDLKIVPNDVKEKHPFWPKMNYNETHYQYSQRLKMYFKQYRSVGKAYPNNPYKYRPFKKSEEFSCGNCSVNLEIQLNWAIISTI